MHFFARAFLLPIIILSTVLLRKEINRYMKQLLTLTLCVGLLLPMAKAQQTDISKQRYSGNQRALQQLAKKLDAAWKKDSTKAHSLEIPFEISDGENTYSFIGFANNMPKYVGTATQDEIDSYYANDLWSAPYNVTGSGFVAGIWEAYQGGSGMPNPNNGNLQTNGNAPTRVALFDTGTTTSNHALNVALRMVGDGALNPNSGQGAAPSALLAAWDVSDVLAELANNATSMLVSNHSYSQIRGWTSPISYTLNGITKDINWWSESNVSTTKDFGFGRYAPDDAILDLISYYAPYHCIVKAAGNDRNDIGTAPITTFNTVDNGATYTFHTYNNPVPEQDGGTDGFDCIPMGTTAKNAFIIGACANISGGYSAPTDVQIMNFSGFGPTDDGRLKPDFVAPGEGGTSYAAPNVSGTIILLQEIAQNHFGYVLRAATIKALLAQTAFEAGNAGPDYKHGWGLINPKGAADVILNTSKKNKIDENYLANGTTKKYYAQINTATDVAITLSWTDPDGTSITRTYNANDLNNTSSMLVNDLNVTLKEIATATTSRPYVLDPNNPNTVATTGTNTRDNCEKIDLQNAPAGWYEIEVSHSGNLVDENGNVAGQAFSLVMSGFDAYACTENAAVNYTTIWDGNSWSANAPTNTTNAIIAENLTLTSNLAVENVLLKEGVEIDLSSFSFTVHGHLAAEGDAQFTGTGNVIFAGNAAQEICGDVQFENLEVNNTNGINVNANQGLTTITNLLTLTDGVLSPNGRVRMRADESVTQRNYAQIHNASGSISGNIYFENVVQGASGWRNLGSPVNTSIGDLLEEQNRYNIANNGGSVYKWNAATSQWVAPTNENDPFDATTPYTVFFGTSVVGSNNYIFNAMPFTCRLYGQPNNGPIQNNLAYHNGSGGSFVGINTDGWNLIANPYPENLDWTEIKNHTDFSNNKINTAYYIWDPSQQKYLSHNGTSGDSELAGTIAPMQAFFVKLADNSAVNSTAFNLVNTDRTITKAAFLKGNFPYLSLGLYNSSDSLLDNTHCGIDSQATLGFDMKHDAYQLKFSPTTASLIYSASIAGTDTTALSINSLPSNQQEILVPVFVELLEAGNFSIGIDSTNFDSQWTIELIDSTAALTTDLSVQKHASTQQQGQTKKLFWLRIYQPNFEIEEKSLAPLDAKIWQSNQDVHITLPQTEVSEIAIYSIDGKLLFTQQNTAQEITINKRELTGSSGVLVVHVQTKSGSTVEKINVIF